jgi:HEPN domain-containing protein
MAKRAIEFSSQYKNIAGFHAQQCAEKSIKGLLAFKKIRVPKTHSLKELAELVNDINPSLAKLILKNHKLTYMAVVYRYPDAEIKPLTLKAVSSAIKNAESIFSRCHHLALGPSAL